MNKLDFSTAFKYSFNRPMGLLNVLWILLPIFGWFALAGYSIRLVQEFSKGKFQQLPLFSFVSDMKLGFMMFLKSIPFVIAYIILLMILAMLGTGIMTTVMILVSIFAIPMLTVNFFNKETVASLFEFGIINSVFSNLGDYIVVLLKSLLLAIIFMILSIVIVGIPASMFTRNIFLADFYRRNVK